MLCVPYSNTTIRMKRSAPSFLVCILAALLAGWLIRFVYFNTGAAEGRDFAQYYTMSWRLLRGLPFYKPFDAATPPDTPPRPNRPPDPPAIALVTWPFAAVSFAAAWRLFMGVSVLLLGASIFAAAALAGWSRTGSFLATALSFCSFPVIVLLMLDHIAVILLPLATGGWLLWRRGRPAGAAVLWGAAAAFKLFPAIWVLALAGTERTKAGLAMMVCLGLTILGAAWIGFEESSKFVTRVLPQASVYQYSDGNFALSAMSMKFSGSLLPGLIMWFLAAGCLWWTLRRTSDLDLRCAAVFLASVLLSPLAWSYYFILLIPPLLVLYRRSRRRPRLMVTAAAVVLLWWPSLLGAWCSAFEPLGIGAARTLFDYIPTFTIAALLASIPRFSHPSA